MVTYSEWFEIVHEEADVTFQERGGLTQELAHIWNNSERELRSMTKREARSHARDLLGS